MAKNKNNPVGCAIFLVIAGVLLCIGNIWAWGLIIGIVGIVVLFCLMLSTDQPNAENFSSTKQNLPPPISKKKKMNREPLALWIPSSNNAKVNGINIGGFIYVGENLPPTNSFQSDSNYGGFEISISYGDHYDNDYDASLIRPSLKINTLNPDNHGNNLGYWPSYSKIPPASRGAYLLWLNSGCNNPDISIGYVFLYFYGLERRLLYDDNITNNPDEPADIINELIRLFSIYSERSNSFKRYVSQLISIAILKYFSDDLDRIPDSVIEAFNFRLCPIVIYKIAQLVRDNSPIPGKWALALLQGHPEISLKMPAKRCANEFQRLFEILYHDKYNEGILIKPNKTSLKIPYAPASGTLGYLDNPADISPDYSDISVLSGPKNKLQYLADQCCDLLNSYSRFIGRTPELKDSVEAIMLLPDQLISSSDSRIASLRDSLIDEEMKERGLRSIRMRQLTELLGMASSESISLKKIRDITNSLKKIGLGFSPDYEYSGLKPQNDQKVVIFELPEETANKTDTINKIQRIMLMLRLGTMLAAADGVISEEETSFLTSLIEEQDMDECDRIRLWAFLEYLLNNKISNSSLKKNLKELSENHRNIVANALVQLVAADGKIEKTEIVQLEKIYKMLDLDEKLIATQIHRSQAAEMEPVLVEGKNTSSGFSIPAEPSEKKDALVDFNKIAAKRKETEEVFNVLDNIFSSEEETIASTPEAKPGLDDKHYKLFEFITTKSEWARKEIEEFCEPLKLMVDGALEVINEYTINEYEEPLIEGDNPIFVELELAEEIKNG